MVRPLLNLEGIMDRVWFTRLVYPSAVGLCLPSCEYAIGGSMRLDKYRMDELHLPLLLSRKNQSENHPCMYSSAVAILSLTRKLRDPTPPGF